MLTSDRILMADPPTSFGRVMGHDDWAVPRLSEEHGVIELPGAAPASIGDRLLIMPNHICPVINLTDSVAVVSDGVFTERWAVAARGRVQ